MQHQFSLLAPNHELAMIMAQENFMRREPVSDIWVVKRSDVRMMTRMKGERCSGSIIRITAMRKATVI